jgi:hypothetical protein
MHPIEFKKKWQLTYDELAQVLGDEGVQPGYAQNRTRCKFLLQSVF